MNKKALRGTEGVNNNNFLVFLEKRGSCKPEPHHHLLASLPRSPHGLDSILMSRHRQIRASHTRLIHLTHHLNYTQTHLPYLTQLTHFNSAPITLTSSYLTHLTSHTRLIHLTHHLNYTQTHLPYLTQLTHLNSAPIALNLVLPHPLYLFVSSHLSTRLTCITGRHKNHGPTH
ncbi:hypothetical protein E2C01_102299 [Portunus trituberculatus]|uniref:Uncharacterized protein n=1 Tax=Portunus trituberculatus TaxID=210409 RepID=A0A5B7KNV6_PORTR|nr:hypothetical protein [Portunus trituberculatus]